MKIKENFKYKNISTIYDLIPNGSIIKLKKFNGKFVIILLEKSGFKFLTRRINFSLKTIKYIKILHLNQGKKL